MPKQSWKSGFWKTACATALYAVVHSALASRWAKEKAEQFAGVRYRNSLYRTFYLAQSLGTMVILIRFISRQPTRPLYRLRGLPAVPFRLAQAGGLAWAMAAAVEVGLPGILGLRPLAQLAVERANIEPKPEAQGPAIHDGRLQTDGPFRWSRHPLNFAPLPILWFHPRMTTTLLAFNVVTLLYMPIGSYFEEQRLHARYGSIYEDYRHSQVPFYWPRRPARQALR